jgi:hypothetical protein
MAEKPEWYAWHVDEEAIVPAITDKCNELARDGYALVTTATPPERRGVILIFRELPDFEGLMPPAP